MNVWNQFLAFTDFDRKQTIVTVASVNADGTSSVTTPGGASYRVLGTSVAAGGKALIQGGKIVAAAPNLPSYSGSV